jgi:hypothetical protein
VDFHPIDNLPNTYGVHAFIPKLKRWISTEGNKIYSENSTTKYTAVVSRVDVEKEILHDNDKNKFSDVGIASRIDIPSNERDLNCVRVLSRHPSENLSLVATHNDFMPRILCPINFSMNPSLSIENKIFNSDFKLDTGVIISIWDSVSRHNSGKLR